MSEHNPLLSTAHLPPFDQIKAEHVEPALDHILAENRARIQAIATAAEQNPLAVDWDSFAAPLEDADEAFSRMWSPVSHLNAVRDSDELRNAYENCLPKISAYSSELGQDKRLFNGYKALASRQDFASLSAPRRKIVNNALRDFRLSGVELDEADQKTYREISERLSKLSNEFSQNLLDATQDWHLDITDESSLAGLPDMARAMAKQTAEQAGVQGWRFNLHAPSFIPVMTYLDDADLRRQMYEAYVTRASEQGPGNGQWDNGPLMEEIVTLRQRLAGLLGFDDYADYSLATKMAQTPSEVIDFLNDLAKRSKAQGKAEFAELTRFARDEYGVETLDAWDVGFYSEKLREKTFAFSKEEVRKYFPVPKVLDGLFAVVHKLFAITVQRGDRPSVWHEDVDFFEIIDKDGVKRGEFYIDLYARDQKRGGAWMAGCVSRRQISQGVQTPVAFLTCNFSSPIGDDPALLTHDEVTTLFHEFGHGLHHMLTLVDEVGVAGIHGVAWDAVELPSQFLENWCWQSESLALIAGHYTTGEPLPQDLLDKMRAARNFQSALQMLRQIEFSLFDMRLHNEWRANDAANKDTTIQNILDEVRDAVAVVKPPAFNRFQNGFAHIFAGGYAAGYYSYKWAEVLSADAFGRFEEEGIFNPKTGEDFRQHILEQGGSAEPMELFVAFRGRKPTVDALLRHSGLTA